MAFPLRHKGHALPMNKIDLPVESGHGDPFHFADPTERYLVDEKTENSGIFVGFSVPDVGDEAVTNVLPHALPR
jgi:hypothetical protein